MNALLATYLAFTYLPTDGAPSLLPGIHRSPVPLVAAARTQRCETAWGENFALGEEVQIGDLNMQCDYVATWVDGQHQGDSVRWVVSAH